MATSRDGALARPRGLPTLGHVLQWRALRQADEVAFVFLVDGEDEEQSLTYAELDLQARAIAGELRHRGATGQKALLVYDAGLDYIAALYGCLYAGVVAVPVYPPDPYRLDRTLPRLQAIVADAQARWLLATDDTLSWAERLFAQVPGLSERVATDRATEPPMEQRDLPSNPDGTPFRGAKGDDRRSEQWDLPSDPDATAVLQYTSGSTGAPRGVLIAHRNLLANLLRIERMLDHDGVVAVSWLPAYHDMGLIGCTFQPVYSGRRTVLMSPTAFMQRPARWLQAISKYRGCTTAAPNFAYELCVRKIAPKERAAFDLSSLTLALNGSETVREETLERFSEAFAPCGFRREAFYPCYGLAEATLMVAGGAIAAPPVVRSFDAAALAKRRVVHCRDDQGAARRLVGCGKCAPGQQLAIVDPRASTRCAADRIGEIWVSGPSVGRGYWNRPRETAEVFQARLAGTDEGPFLRTGDLGFLDDGELFIVGRVKDLIILHGRNYYPQDIEQTVVHAHGQLKPDGGAAFSVDIDGQERLVIVQEVLRPRKVDFAEAFASIRRAVAEEHELPVHSIVLIAAGSLPKTSSGKVRRGASRESFLAGALDTVATWPAGEAGNGGDGGNGVPAAPALPQSRIETSLAALWAEVLGVETVGVDERFFDLGGQSLLGARLLARVRDTFGVELPLVALFEAPTVAQLAQRIAVAAPISNSFPIVHADRNAEDRNAGLPLSFAQQRLWFLEQLQSAPRYNVPVAVSLGGRLDRAVLEACLDDIVRRHEVLRTQIVSRDGRPAQLILPDRRVPLEFIDWRAVDRQGGERQGEARLNGRNDRSHAIQALLDDQARLPFDLEHDSLVRATLVRERDDEHMLILTAHHIVCDGWSLGVFLRELAALYQSRLAGLPDGLAELRCQYADFAAWQRRWLSGPVLAEQLAHWQTLFAAQFTAQPPPLELATDRPRGVAHRFRGAAEAIELPAELRSALEVLGRESGATLYMTLLAAYEALLARYSRLTEFCLGTVVANRARVEFEPLIGLFINTLPLVVDVSGRPGFRELLRRVRGTVLSAFAHQDVPFDKLVETLAPGRDAGTPLFQSMFVFEDVPWRAADLPLGSAGAADLTIRDVRVDHRAIAEYDLSLVIDDRNGTLAATMVYDAELFDAATIRRMLATFEILLRGVVAAPDRPLAEMPLNSPDDERRLLVEWNHGETVPIPVATIAQLFTAQADRSPDAVAVICGERRLSYRDLDGRANQLARYLQALRVGPDVPVGVFLERSAEMVVAVLGILKAGGTYVPLDPLDPPERLSTVLDDSRPRVVLSDRKLVGSLPRHEAKEVLFDADGPAIGRERTAVPPQRTSPGDLAYLIYTSGSTGRPKGVEVPQRGLVNHALALAEKLGCRVGRRVLHVVSLAFDAAAEELFPTLVSGATLVIPPPDAELSGRQVLDDCLRNSIDILHLPTVLWRQCVQELQPRDAAVLDQVKTLLIGGESPPAETLRQWFDIAPQVRMLYAYGLTEATITSTIHEVRPPAAGASFERLPIGRPIANTEVYILDDEMRPMPIGAAGELYIGGLGLARGYHGQPQLTAERFVRNPLGGSSERLCRTGDLARFRDDGELEFLGRVDQQVKLHGFRVEPGEIEQAIEAHFAVSEAAVVLREDAPGARRLVAYIVLAPGAPSLNGELRDWLRSKLPGPMVPSAFVTLAALPRTSHHKLDRLALPPPAAASKERPGAWVRPRTRTETLLTDIWAQVLSVERVGIDDNFFELGGDSIQTIQVVSRARQAGIQITAKQFFEHQTIGQLAAIAAPVVPSSDEREPAGKPIPITPIQHWFFQQEPVDPHHFNQSVSLDVAPTIGPDVLETALTHLAHNHDALRLRFTHERVDWRATHAEIEAAAWPIERFDLQDLPAAEQAAQYAAGAADLQASLDLERGPVARAGWFDLGPDCPRRLLLVMHHLAVDAVSWRILLADLQTVVGQILRGEPPSLPPATTSLARWAERLHEYSRSPELGAEADFWLDESRREIARLPQDYEGGENRRITSRVACTVLDEAVTAELLKPGRSGGAAIHELLTAALARVIGRCTGSSRVQIDIEGHGRVPLFDDLDTSRTVGWFTALYPLLLEIPGELSPDQAVQCIRNTVERTPNQGIGYGLLRYLRGDEALSTALAAMPQAEICFNYLGRFERSFDAESPLNVTGAGSGPRQSPRQRRAHLIEINADIRDGRLHVEWTYSHAIHRRETVEGWTRSLVSELRALVCVGSGATTGQAVPGDVEGGADPSLPLTGMQHLMLIHALRDPDSEVLQEELHCTVVGALDAASLRRAWQTVLRRHSALRTSFRWRNEGEPRQVVEPAVELPFDEHDWRGVPAAEQERRLRTWHEAKGPHGFDLERAPLLRLALARLADDRFHFSLRAHHLLFDGWSLALVASEVFEIYQSLVAGHEPRLVAAPDFGEYIAWIERQDRTAAQRYWRQELAGSRGDTPLGFAAPTAGEIERPDSAQYGELRRTLSRGVTAPLVAWTRRERLTLGSLLAGAWGLLLARHSGHDDVLFGVTVSGRPAELVGVERMVGPLLNNLPLRVRLSSSESPAAWLRHIQGSLAELGHYSYCSLSDIGEWTGIKTAGRLFQSLVVFQNYPLGADSTKRPGAFTVHDLEATARTGYPLTLVVVPGPELGLLFRYDATRFSSVAVQAALTEFDEILRDLVDDKPHSIGMLVNGAAAMTPDGEGGPHPSAIVRPAAAPFVAPRDDLERQLAELWSRLLHFAPPDTRDSRDAPPPIGVHDNFFALGGDSLLAVRLMAEVERVHGRRLPLAWIFQDATIENLACVLRAPEVKTIDTPLVPIRAALAGMTSPLFCIHPAGGTVFCYRELARHLPATRPVYGLQARGIDGLQPPHTRIEDMAADYLAAIRSVQPEGPYFVTGWSLGGIVAFELVRQLVAAGGEVGRLIVIDAGMVSPNERFREEDFLPVLLALFPDEHRPTLDELRGMEPAQQLEFFRRRAEQAQLVAAGAGPLAGQHVFQVFQANLNALAEYRPGPYAGCVSLFRAADDATPLHADRRMGWDEWAAGGVEVVDVAGDHVRLFNEPYVSALAERIEAMLPCQGLEPLAAACDCYGR
ncbi:MAG TPA: amino acid adenylation domain-containing protein [Pirellulales bacterium]|nr:amino acid adenylation domain-containing protein [Pirellulales bacterium]